MVTLLAIICIQEASSPGTWQKWEDFYYERIKSAGNMYHKKKAVRGTYFTLQTLWKLSFHSMRECMRSKPLKKWKIFELVTATAPPRTEKPLHDDLWASDIEMYFCSFFCRQAMFPSTIIYRKDDVSSALLSFLAAHMLFMSPIF